MAAMLPKTRYNIYNACEDWLIGYTAKELAAKYQRSLPTISRWMHTGEWKKCQAGRTRQKKKSPAQVDKHQDFYSMQVAAIRWVAFGKPSAVDLAHRLSTAVDTIQKWMDTEYWSGAVAYAESQVAREQKMYKRRRRKGPQYGDFRLKQAVFLELAGWTIKEIGPAIGRAPATVQDWKYTDVWVLMREEVMLSKLLMHMADRGLSTRDMFEAICRSQGFDRFSR